MAHSFENQLQNILIDAGCSAILPHNGHELLLGGLGCDIEPLVLDEKEG